MQSAFEGPPPSSLGRRPAGARRRTRLLAALTATACLTAPLAGIAASDASVQWAVAPTTQLDEQYGLESTAVSMMTQSDSQRAAAIGALSWPDIDLSLGTDGVPGLGPTPHGSPFIVTDALRVTGFDVGTPGMLARSPYVSPVPGPITSRFGPRLHPILGFVRNHNGVDMTADCGTPVVAMADGVVTRSAIAGGYGLLVEVDHGTIDEDRLVSRYAHLSVLGARVGQRVTKGQQIGLAGTTGLSTGCHLHFEVLMNGSYVDPAAVLSGAPHVRLTSFQAVPTPTGATRITVASARTGSTSAPPTSAPATSAAGTPTPSVDGTPTPSVDGTPTPSVDGTPTPSVDGTPTPTADGTTTPTPTESASTPTTEAPASTETPTTSAPASTTASASTTTSADTTSSATVTSSATSTAPKTTTAATTSAAEETTAASSSATTAAAETTAEAAETATPTP